MLPTATLLQSLGITLTYPVVLLFFLHCPAFVTLAVSLICSAAVSQHQPPNVTTAGTMVFTSMAPSTLATLCCPYIFYAIFCLSPFTLLYVSRALAGVGG